MKARFEVQIMDYNAHETDFRAMLDRRPDLLGPHPLGPGDPDLSSIVDSAFEAFENTGGNKSCAIVIIGYADREDSPGLTDGQKRASELQASTARANSASAWLLDQVNSKAQASGMQLEMDWKGVAAVAVEAIGVGASDLAAPPTDELARLHNRRIRFLVSGNNVDIVTALDGGMDTFG